LASEGINAQLSHSPDLMNKKPNIYEFLKDTIGFKDINIKVNIDNKHPFKKHLVWRHWREIIPLGVGDIEVNKLKGDYLEGKDWDEKLRMKNTLCIDTRNKYETVMGTFEHSIDPLTNTFKEFPDWVINEFILNLSKYADIKDNSILDIESYHKLCE